MRQKPTTYPWYKAAIDVFRQLGGSRVVEIVNEPILIGDGQGQADQSSTSLWRSQPICAQVRSIPCVSRRARKSTTSRLSRTTGKST